MLCDELQERISNGESGTKIRKQIAWLEKRVKKMENKAKRMRKYEVDFDEYLEREIEKVSREDGEINFYIKDVGWITVCDAYVVKEEIKIEDLSEKCIVKAIEFYSFRRGNKLSLLIERRDQTISEYYYVSVIGSAIRAVR